MRTVLSSRTDAVASVRADLVLGQRDATIVDLRSPGEFAGDHLPGATNVPLFDDDERALVGTLYRKVSPDAAFEAGRSVARAKVARGDFHDTQCGLKLFRADVWKELFGLSRIEGFGFDLGVLSLARRFGVPVVEVPIRCEHMVGGTVRLRMYLRVLSEVARVTSYRLRGLYPRASQRTSAPAQGRVFAHRARE